MSAAVKTKAHKRSHNLLLLQKLLNLRDGASPLTLVLDSLEQKAKPVIQEFITRANISNSKVIFLSFTTLLKPKGVDVFLKAARRDLQKVQRELITQFPTFDPSSKQKPSSRAVLIIDSLNAVTSSASQSVAQFLSSIIHPAVSIVAVYHSDVPLVLPRSFSEYQPHPFTLLCHLATAILRISNLQQEIERQAARNRALVEPEWGLKEGREGVIIGLRLGASGKDRRGVVIEMELRRRSGTASTEKFILTTSPATSTVPGELMMLTDHAVFSPGSPDDEQGEEGEQGPESTFNLDLTEKQRKDREGIVLPYFDAQTDVGAGQGGRILYEMGREDDDDFDDEEDEI